MTKTKRMNGLKIPGINFYQWFWMFFLLFHFTGANTEAQRNYNFFYGKVFEAGTKTAMAGVNLSVDHSRIGTSTDNAGSFSFFIDSLPAVLTVSYVGFETKTILIDSTSYSLTLYLTRKATNLQEVEIKARSHEAFFKDDHYAVLDYEIDSGLVYLLIYKSYLSHATLICKNLNGDTVATSLPFYFRPDKLFRDCLGFLHVLSRDSGFQVFRQGNQIHLIHPVDLKKFDDVLKNCVAATPEILFFQKVTDHGMGMEYYGVNRKTFQKTSLSRITDEKKMKMLRRNPEDAYWLGSSIQPDGREDFVSWNYVHKILYRPIRTALYRIGEYICIFNTPDHQAEFYDGAGNFSYKLLLKTDKVNDGRWTNDVLIDEVTGKVYTVFIQNGIYHVYQINLDDGMLNKRISLFHPYPEKVRIYNDWVFYLYDLASDPDNKMLYRQKF
jgi:hypothetical protein